jgi:hypothetical protein
MSCVTYSGKTEDRTNKVIDKARGATLLVDEAYQLTPVDSSHDFGIVAVETIMATIEGGEATIDDRPAYIFAGYCEDMQRFVNSNSGLKRRITDTFIFENYCIEELFEICRAMAVRSAFKFLVDKAVALATMKECFPLALCANYNAAISHEIFIATKCKLNERVMRDITTCTSADVVRNHLMVIVNSDFIEGCKMIEMKLKC